ncbi:MAG TPA: hypothetical protein VKB59_02790 [Micromonosporaceae bacterium]|nr:hypothetical protein [Micromonosporaceae bacterium]
MTAPDAGLPTCECCRLPQHAHRDMYGIRSPLCTECEQHRGDAPPARLRRAESHEQLLRERLAHYRDYAERMWLVADEAKQQAAGAVAGRDGLAARVVRDAATERRHTCALHAIAFDPAVREWATSLGPPDFRR